MLISLHFDHPIPFHSMREILITCARKSHPGQSLRPEPRPQKPFHYLSSQKPAKKPSAPKVPPAEYPSLLYDPIVGEYKSEKGRELEKKKGPKVEKFQKRLVHTERWAGALENVQASHSRLVYEREESHSLCLTRRPTVVLSPGGSYSWNYQPLNRRFNFAPLGHALVIEDLKLPKSEASRILIGCKERSSSTSSHQAAIPYAESVGPREIKNFSPCLFNWHSPRDYDPVKGVWSDRFAEKPEGLRKNSAEANANVQVRVGLLRNLLQGSRNSVGLDEDCDRTNTLPP